MNSFKILRKVRCIKHAVLIRPVFLIACFLFFFLISFKTNAQEIKPYLNTKLSTEQRVEDIVKKLTLSQKIKLLQYRGIAINTTELEIPAYNWWNECLHGVARAGKATSFPQAIGLAATWDTALIGKVADAISDEARAKYAYFSKTDKRGIYQGLNFWTPNINIFRDPRWGRGMETYGEDPYLTGKIASSFIRGLQGSNPNYFKTIATVKHFAVHSGPEQSRHRYNAIVSDRDFYETYTPAFKMAVQEAGVYSLMCAYNSFKDKPCCGSDFLLTDLLRNQWGFKGFIVTDCGAVDDFFRKGAHEVVASPEEAAAMAIKAGVDLECGNVFDALDKAVEKKLVTEQELDVCIKRLFTARFKLGFFDPPSLVPYTNIPYTVVENKEHINMALIAARKSIVLLKNTHQLLPLNKSIKTLAVIGPNADDEEVLLANYHGFPSHIVTPLEGIKNKLPNVNVLYARGAAHVEGLPVLDVIQKEFLFTTLSCKVNGLNGTYFANKDFNGIPKLQRIDQQIDFNWMSPTASTPSFFSNDFSAKWEGYLKVPINGSYILDVYGSSQYELFINDTVKFSFTSDHGPEHNYTTIKLEQNKPCKILIKYVSYGSCPVIKFNWQNSFSNYKEDALAIAKKADVVIMCMGLSPRIEGEEMKIKLDGFDGGDRTALKLPDVQETLIKEIVALGKPVVLVLINGSALAINWENQNIPAILETWYGGQEGGNAIADVIFGDFNPGGKLPVTFYKSEKDLPDFENYDMKGRTYRYFEGDVLYPFGYGLSYTHFSFSNFNPDTVFDMKKTIAVSVDIQNTGNRDGEEVVELYLKNLTATVPVPLKSLKGFQRIFLKKGEKKRIIFTIKPSDFLVIDNSGKEQVEPGRYVISIGGGQPLKTSQTNGNNNIISKSIQLK